MTTLGLVVVEGEDHRRQRKIIVRDLRPEIPPPRSYVALESLVWPRPHQVAVPDFPREGASC